MIDCLIKIRQSIRLSSMIDCLIKIRQSIRLSARVPIANLWIWKTFWKPAEKTELFTDRSQNHPRLVQAMISWAIDAKWSWCNRCARPCEHTAHSNRRAFRGQWPGAGRHLPFFWMPPTRVGAVTPQTVGRTMNTATSHSPSTAFFKIRM